MSMHIDEKKDMMKRIDKLKDYTERQNKEIQREKAKKKEGAHR